MKAKLNLDQFADVTTITEENRAKLSFVAGKGPGGKPVPIAIYPAGTIFEGDLALQLCRTGQASPADDECANALDMKPDQIASLQVEYKMDVLGLNKKEDRELYRAGVILGYDKDLNYIHGPNWDAYQLAKMEMEEEEEI